MRGRSSDSFYIKKVVEYTLLRNTSLTYQDLAVMPVIDVWRYYSMYLEEQDIMKEEHRKAERKSRAGDKVRWV